MIDQASRTSFEAGLAALAQHAWAQAEQHFLAVLAHTDLAAAHANLALALHRQRRLEAARLAYRAALERSPDDVEILRNFSTVLLDLGEVAEAEACLRHALGIAPDELTLCSALGVTLACAGREADAEACYREILQRAPGYANARFNLAWILLRQGRFAEGWACFEARDWYAGLQRLINLPRWQGEALHGQRFLIGIEAGHGDMIQCVRYANALKSRGASRVGVLCHPGLQALFARAAGLDEVLPLDQAFDASRWDVWSPPLSLPFCCHPAQGYPDASLPYLGADPARSAHWREWLGAKPAAQLRVGLVWRGSVNFENDRFRSLPSLATLAPLWQVPGIEFISLQKGAGEDEAQTSSLPLRNPAAALQDFADTAALITQLDLVISVDTAVAHLAGALGKACWIMIPAYRPDWRWLSDRSDSPWYPAVMRLFRQGDKGHWESVVEEMKEALQDFQASAAQRPSDPKHSA